MKRIVLVLTMVLVFCSVARTEELRVTGETILFYSDSCSFLWCKDGFEKIKIGNTCDCEKKFGHCPFCGTTGMYLGWLQIDKAGGLNLYACPKCHLLFWEDSKIQ